MYTREKCEELNQRGKRMKTEKDQMTVFCEEVRKMNKEIKEKNVQNKKTQIIIIVLIFITLIAVAVAVWALFFRNAVPDLTPDYAPQETEEHAELILDDSGDEKMETTKGGGAVSMIYQKEVQISLADQRATLLFQNPSKSVNNIVLQLVICSKDGTDTIIAQSGTLSPGYKVEQLDLLKDVATLSEGEYSGKFNVLYYDPDTGEKSVLNSTIEGLVVSVVK